MIKLMRMKNYFHRTAVKVSDLTGSIWAFLLALLGIIVWVVSGPYYHFSNTWLIAIATITDVAIFLMVFLMQNTQIRDSKAIQLKLNELIIADTKARDAFVGLETLTEEELAELDNEFKQMLLVIAPSHPLHKLHNKIKQEKAVRFNLPEQAERLMDSLLSQFTDDQSK